MFERFTDRARKALVLAQEEARSLNHSSAGPEHLLLGLLAEGEGLAARALRELGVEADAVTNRVLDHNPAGQLPAAEPMPFTPDTKRALEASREEALALGHDYVARSTCCSACSTRPMEWRHRR